MPWPGSDAWPFVPGPVDPQGLLGWLVEIADEEFDLGLLRSLVVLAGVAVALAAALVWRQPTWPRGAAIAFTVVIVGTLLVPATLLQVGLRDATEPWLFTNDSTYQIELAGDLILDGDNPYGHDYSDSGPSASTRRWTRLPTCRRLRWTTSPTSRGRRSALRRGGSCRARSTTTGSSSCSRRSASSLRRCSFPRL